jgi:hypothetical protein
MDITKNTAFSLITTVRELLCFGILVCSDVGPPTYVEIIAAAHNYPQVIAGEYVC